MMRFSAAIRRDRTEYGLRLVLHLMRPTLEVRFARTLPWAKHITTHTRAHRTTNGWRWFLDVPPIGHLQVEYDNHAGDTRPTTKKVA